MSNPKALLSTAASIAASAMLICSIAYDFLPHELINFFHSAVHNISRQFSSQFTIVIEEFKGLLKNEVFEAVEVYLGNKATVSAQRIKVSKSEDHKKLSFMVDRNEEVIDIYDNIRVKWKLVSVEVESSGANPHHLGDVNLSLRPELRSYQLTFHKKDKLKVFNFYLPYILEKAKAIQQEHKAVKLHTKNNYSWSEYTVNFDHPMTFKTLAIDAELKKELLNDLDKFMKGREFYRRTGKAWKRGYLLYGPPGTGKSSLIAAMANYLNYDIYDLDLASVFDNGELKALLLAMSNRSILVVEDIDCTIRLQNREEEDQPFNNGENKVTLSGFLNVIDGLWSCCAEERIIVFTTNHKERLDPALLRPGRMDMHVNLSYCTASVFKQLAFNYLGVSQHNSFQEIEGLMKEVQVTPAEIAGELTKSVGKEDSFQDVVKFLHNKKMQQQDSANLKEDDQQAEG